MLGRAAVIAAPSSFGMPSPAENSAASQDMPIEPHPWPSPQMVGRSCRAVMIRLSNFGTPKAELNCARCRDIRAEYFQLRFPSMGSGSYQEVWTERQSCGTWRAVRWLGQNFHLAWA